MDTKTESLDTKSYSIDPRVSLGEAVALSEYHRNRALLLAQALFECDLKVAGLEKQLVEMAATIEAQTGELAALRPAAAVVDEESN